MAANHLEVITRRGRTQKLWCGYKTWYSKDCLGMIKYICVLYDVLFLYVLFVKLTLSACGWR